MQPNQPRRPCKFGDTCRSFLQGNCTFLHDSEPEQGSRNYNPNMNSNMNQNMNSNMNQNMNPNMNSNQPRRPCKFGDTCRSFLQGNCTFLHDSESQQGNQNYNSDMNSTMNPNINSKFNGPRNPNFSHQQNFTPKN